MQTISNYLSGQPKENLGIEGAKVTHIWTDDPADAVSVAKTSLIDNVMEKATDCIGEVRCCSHFHGQRV